MKIKVIFFVTSVEQVLTIDTKKPTKYRRIDKNKNSCKIGDHLKRRSAKCTKMESRPNTSFIDFDQTKALTDYYWPQSISIRRTLFQLNCTYSGQMKRVQTTHTWKKIKVQHNNQMKLCRELRYESSLSTSIFSQQAFKLHFVFFVGWHKKKRYFKNIFSSSIS